MMPVQIRRCGQRPPRSGRMVGHLESVPGTAIRAPQRVLGRALFVDIGSTPARQTKSMGLGVFRSCGLLPDAPSRSKPVDGSPIHFYGILSYHPGGSVKGGQ